MAIEHLVISGGANIGFAFFGTLKTLFTENYLDLDKIKTIHATSVGTCLAFYFTAGYSLDDLENYLINRPWKHLYKMDFHTIVRAIQHGGMFDYNAMLETVKPLLLGKDLSVDITLKEYYDYCGKEINFYSTEYSELKLVRINYKTHPQWKLVEALYASSCLPVLFTPFLKDGTYYIDGAMIMNYPLLPCLEDGCDPNSIFGLYHNTSKEVKLLRKSKPFMNAESSYKLLEYMVSLSMKLWTHVKHERTERENQCKYQIALNHKTNMLDIIKAFESKEERMKLYEVGETAARDYLASEASHL